MRLPLAATLIVGAALLWFASRRERSRVPRWVPTLAIAIASLGVSVAVASQPGLGWSISSICFSLVAIAGVSPPGGVWTLGDWPGGRLGVGAWAGVECVHAAAMAITATPVQQTARMSVELRKERRR